MVVFVHGTDEQVLIVDEIGTGENKYLIGTNYSTYSALSIAIIVRY